MKIEEEQIARAGAESIIDYIGLWINNFQEGDAILRIRKDKSGFWFEYVSPDNPMPSASATRIRRVSSGGKIIFTDTENRAQYFVLESNGDLSAYDQQGGF